MIRVYFKSHRNSEKIHYIECPDQATALFVEAALFRNHWVLLPREKLTGRG